MIFRSVVPPGGVPLRNKIRPIFTIHAYIQVPPQPFRQHVRRDEMKEHIVIDPSIRRQKLYPIPNLADHGK